MTREKRIPYDTNVATLPSNDPQNGRNYGNTKETTSHASLVVFHDGDIHEPVIARWYMGRARSASVVYCSLWVFTADRKRSFAGSGSAGGHGYCKQSAAFDAACRSAGIKLAGNVSAAGMEAVRAAMFAIGRAIGFDVTAARIIE